MISLAFGMYLVGGRVGGEVDSCPLAVVSLPSFLFHRGHFTTAPSIDSLEYDVLA